MKKKYYGIINLALLIILGLAIYNAFNVTKLGNTYKIRYDVIEKSIVKIEKNMQEITSDDKWESLKPLQNVEESLVVGFDMLVKDIKACYTEVKDFPGLENTDIKILDFKNKSKISNKKLDELYKNNCLDNFDKYNDYQFTEDEDLNTKLQEQISLIVTIEKNIDSKKSFEDLIIRESNIIHNLANLSNWLKIEYNTYK
ncbi:MAG: hypothetical protein PHX04_01510 [Bacilli bacterium]|nr:hypothetical protein [Bacilli bacterium]